MDKEEQDRIMYGNSPLDRKYLKLDKKRGPEDYFFIFKDGTIADVENGEIGEAVEVQVVRESRLNQAMKKGWNLAIDYFPDKMFRKLLEDKYELLLGVHHSRMGKNEDGFIYGINPCYYAIIVPRNQIRNKQKEGWQTVEKFFKKPTEDVDELHIPVDKGIFIYLDPRERKMLDYDGHWYVQNKKVFNYF